MKFDAGVDVDRIEEPGEMARFTAIALNQLVPILNNGLTFSDNFDAKIITMTFSAANTDTAALHGLGRVPIGYIPLGQTAATNVYDGASTTTSQVLYLRASAVATVRLLVF